MVSVIIPVYNTPKELEKCLAGLAKQTFKDFEVIVVDDGSTEPVGSVISNFQFPRLPIGWSLKATGDQAISNFRISHGGAPKARNYGFSKSSGEYVLFCDADMVLDKNCLIKMKKVLDENQRVDFVYSDFKYGWKEFRFWEFDKTKLRQNNYINTCSMVRREKVVNWDEKLVKFQDWDFWLTIVEAGGQGKYIPEILFQAIIRRGKISNWLPRWVYRFTFLPKVKKYNRLAKIIKQKHKLV